MAVSLPYFAKWKLETFRMSLMYKLDSVGLRNELCGTVQSWTRSDGDTAFPYYGIRMVIDINATRCGKIGKKIELHDKLIIELTEYELCPERLRLYIFLGVSLAMTTLTAISVHIVYSRYRYHLKVWLYSRGFSWLKKKDDRDLEKKHDAFLSFSDKDLDFVRTHLIPVIPRLTRIRSYAIYKYRQFFFSLLIIKTQVESFPELIEIDNLIEEVVCVDLVMQINSAVDK
ncbi:uncharacterized protein TNCV_387241 [Trichonephila clavipes]|nr:uncharacterized protein TNCV_387241 [Trichonephila clavipes]